MGFYEPLKKSTSRIQVKDIIRMTVDPRQGVYCDNYVCTGCLFPASVSTGNNQDTAGPAPCPVCHVNNV